MKEESVKRPHSPLDLEKMIDSARMSFESDIKQQQRGGTNKRMKGSRELANLEKDEGVMYLLHALPSTRRKIPGNSSSNGGSAAPSSHHQHHPSDSLKGGSTSGVSSLTLSQRRPSAEVSVRPRTPLALTQMLSSNKNNLRKSFRPQEVRKVSPESLKNERTLSMLQKLPSTEYFKLWKSPTRYSLNNDERSNEVEGQGGTVRGIHKTYKDILVRSYSCFVQIILCPSTTGLKNTINVNVCEELMDAISVLRKDPNCRALILSGLGGVFSHGIDLSLLTYKSAEKQRKNAESLANAIRRLVLSLLACEELALVAAVNGEARGLGVSWLPLFDVVFASDKAVLSTPYARLGMIPEAGARTTFSSLLPRLSEMTLLGKSITALEAKSLGLVSDVLWPDKFFEEIIPRLQMTSLLSSSGIQILKKALKEPLKKRVLEVLDEDTKTLASQWASPLFVKNAKAYLKTCHHV